MKKFWILALTGFLAACNNDSGNVTDAANDTNSTRPRDVNEAVPNNMRLENDSTIVPDPNNIGADPSVGVDTVGPMRKNAGHNSDNAGKQDNNNNNNNNNNNQ